MGEKEGREEGVNKKGERRVKDAEEAGGEGGRRSSGAEEERDGGLSGEGTSNNL